MCGGQSCTGAGSLRVLRFSLLIFIPPIAPQTSSSIIWGWYNRPIVAAVTSGLATHVLCECEAIAHLRFRDLGQFFMEQGDLYDIRISKVLHFIRSVGLTKG
jgi:hypothetical protein